MFKPLGAAYMVGAELSPPRALASPAWHVEGDWCGLPYLTVPDEREVGSGAVRHGRRLADKILVAFHHACDLADYEVAEGLLRLLELMVSRRPTPPDGSRRRSMESLVAAHERLWYLKHPRLDD